MIDIGDLKSISFVRQFGLNPPIVNGSSDRSGHTVYTLSFNISSRCHSLNGFVCFFHVPCMSAKTILGLHRLVNN